jgi:hypothetical protein
MTISIDRFYPAHPRFLDHISQLNQIDDVKKLNSRNPA